MAGIRHFYGLFCCCPRRGLVSWYLCRRPPPRSKHDGSETNYSGSTTLVCLLRGKLVEVLSRSIHPRSVPFWKLKSSFILWANLISCAGDHRRGPSMTAAGGTRGCPAATPPAAFSLAQLCSVGFPTCYTLLAVLWIRIRMFMGLLDPDPVVRDPDPSIIKQK